MSVVIRFTKTADNRKKISYKMFISNWKVIHVNAAFEAAKLKHFLFHAKCLASVCDISKNKFHFEVVIACLYSERKKAKTKTKEAINTDQKKVSRTQNIWQNCSKSKNELFVTWTSARNYSKLKAKAWTISECYVISKVQWINDKAKILKRFATCKVMCSLLTDEALKNRREEVYN